MQTDLELAWTGERLVTSHLGDTAVEHLHRYAFAREYALDKDVLDIACGEGYGAFHLADVARSVVGVDISEEVVAFAQQKYAKNKRISFRAGNCSAIPLDDASVDLVVSFETLEHHDEHHEMLREVKRVLRPGGTLVISTPDRLHCTIIPKNFNPYHFRELFKEEFQQLMQTFFANVYLFEQKICHASVMTPGAGSRIAEFRHYRGDFRRLIHIKGIDGPLFNLAVATDSDVEPPLNVSLFEGMEIPTEVEKHLAEARQTTGELQARLAEREAHVAWLERHQEDIVADYQSILAKQEQHFHGAMADLERRHQAVVADLQCHQQAALAERDARLAWHASAEQTHVREIASLHDELRAIAGSRAWRLTQGLKRCASVLRGPRALTRRGRSVRS
jgi:ubiquinone/menaquinone biosynthesis C-methylase UbiE